MQIANRLAGVWRRRRGQWKFLIEAVPTLAAASAALRLMPFRRAIRFGLVRLGAPSRPKDVDSCIWAVTVAARRLPWRSVCIHQGLAAQRMLRRRGIDARLHYGVRHESSSGKLEAHVWVTAGGLSIIGGEEADGFAEVASYP
jgi:hypothetical protein